MAVRYLADMAPTLLVISLIISVCAAVPNKQSRPDCVEFAKNTTFQDNQAVGTWHLLQYKTEIANGSGESQCVMFTPVLDQERKDLKQRIEKYVNGLNWDMLVLKMQIPCSTNRTRHYYLEKLSDGDGSYRTLQMPAPTAKLETSEFHRYAMRLKTIEDQYLGLMDCQENFVFVLGKQPPGKQVNENLKKFIEMYWPEN